MQPGARLIHAELTSRARPKSLRFKIRTVQTYVILFSAAVLLPSRGRSLCGPPFRCMGGLSLRHLEGTRVTSPAERKQRPAIAEKQFYNACHSTKLQGPPRHLIQDPPAWNFPVSSRNSTANIYIGIPQRQTLEPAYNSEVSSLTEFRSAVQCLHGATIKESSPISSCGFSGKGHPCDSCNLLLLFICEGKTTRLDCSSHDDGLHVLSSTGEQLPCRVSCCFAVAPMV
jgi:hypothetical protein